jgi:hypothetical protein
MGETPFPRAKRNGENGSPCECCPRSSAVKERRTS